MSAVLPAIPSLTVKRKLGWEGFEVPTARSRSSPSNLAQMEQAVGKGYSPALEAARAAANAPPVLTPYKQAQATAAAAQGAYYEDIGVQRGVEAARETERVGRENAALAAAAPGGYLTAGMPQSYWEDETRKRTAAAQQRAKASHANLDSRLQSGLITSAKWDIEDDLIRRKERREIAEAEAAVRSERLTQGQSAATQQATLGLTAAGMVPTDRMQVPVPQVAEPTRPQIPSVSAMGGGRSQQATLEAIAQELAPVWGNWANVPQAVKDAALAKWAG